MLPHRVRHLLRPTRLYCEGGELSEKRRNRNLRDALRAFGVEIERGRYPLDSVRSQVLHDHPDKIDSHFVPPIAMNRALPCKAVEGGAGSLSPALKLSAVSVGLTDNF